MLNPGVRNGADVQLRHNTTVGIIVDRDGTERGNPVIGDGVDLGATCAVLGPIVIGHGARIGALAMVTKDVPDWGIAVGNPARVIRVDEPRSEAAAMPPSGSVAEPVTDTDATGAVDRTQPAVASRPSPRRRCPSRCAAPTGDPGSVRKGRLERRALALMTDTASNACWAWCFWVAAARLYSADQVGGRPRSSPRRPCSARCRS